MAMSPDAILPSRGQADLMGRARPQSRGPQQLADVLERVLDKGIVIAGDIQVRLLDIELLTIKLRLVVASLERARAMGIDWWEGDPFLSTRAQRSQLRRAQTRPRSLRGKTEQRRVQPAAKKAHGRPTRRAPKKR